MTEAQARVTGKILGGLAWLAIAIGIAYSCAQPDEVRSWTVETCVKACGDRGIAKVTDAECSCRP